MFYQVIECDAKDATHTGTSVAPIFDLALNEIEKPKIIDLSGMVGNTEILFEFADSGKKWWEGYLYKIHAGAFRRSIKVNGETCPDSFFKRVRFQTDRWYPWSGGKCPLPEGVEYETQVVGLNDSGNPVIMRYYKVSDACWKHQDDRVKVISFRITGLIDGYEYKI